MTHGFNSIWTQISITTKLDPKHQCRMSKKFKFGDISKELKVYNRNITEVQNRVSCLDFFYWKLYSKFFKANGSKLSYDLLGPKDVANCTWRALFSTNS